MWRVMVVGLVACSASGASVRIDLRTDLLAPDEIARIETALRSDVAQIDVTADSTLVDGVRIADFESVPHGDYQARVRLDADPIWIVGLHPLVDAACCVHP